MIIYREEEYFGAVANFLTLVITLPHGHPNSNQWLGKRRLRDKMTLCHGFHGNENEKFEETGYGFYRCTPRIVWRNGTS